MLIGYDLALVNRCFVKWNDNAKREDTVIGFKTAKAIVTFHDAADTERSIPVFLRWIGGNGEVVPKDNFAYVRISDFQQQFV